MNPLPPHDSPHTPDTPSAGQSPRHGSPAGGPEGTSTPSGRRLSTAELFELASLDALGLLDEPERREFEEAFQRAPSALRAQLRAQEARMVELESTLPRVEPPATLRARVIAAVQEAYQAARAGRLARLQSLAGSPALLPARGVSPIWRAAAIGCAAAAIVFGVATQMMRERYRELDTAFTTSAALELYMREFGPRFEQMFVDPQTRFVQFQSPVVPAAPAAAGDARPVEPGAVLMLNPRSRQATFYCRRLPEESGRYDLVIIAPDGTATRAVLSFIASGPSVAKQIEELDVPDGATLSLESITPAGVRSVLRSDSL